MKTLNIIAKLVIVLHFINMLFISLSSSCLNWFRAASSYFLSINFSNVEIRLEELLEAFFSGIRRIGVSMVLTTVVLTTGMLLSRFSNNKFYMIRYYRLPYVRPFVNFDIGTSALELELELELILLTSLFRVP